MIRYLRHDQVDADRWDDCIREAVNGIFYAYSWYLDMCAGTWDALVEDDYRTVMPLPYREKAGIKYLFQPYFVQQLGVFSRQSLGIETTRRFLDAIPSGFRFAEFSLNTFNKLEAEHPYIAGKGITYELDLISPYGQIRQNYSSNLRRKLKKGDEKGVFITPHGRPEEIIRAFRNNRGRRGVPYGEKDYQLLKHLVYSGMHRGMVSIRCAYTETNDFCAGIIFFTSHKKSVLLFSGSTPEAYATNAMSLLIDHYIREQAGKELVLDFEGSSDPNLARFYRSFGSEECVFLHIQINRLPFILKMAAGIYLYVRKYLR